MDSEGHQHCDKKHDAFLPQSSESEGLNMDQIAVPQSIFWEALHTGALLDVRQSLQAAMLAFFCDHFD